MVHGGGPRHRRAGADASHPTAVARPASVQPQRLAPQTGHDARWDELSTLARDRVRAYDERVVAGLWREALGLD